MWKECLTQWFYSISWMTAVTDYDKSTKAKNVKMIININNNI